MASEDIDIHVALRAGGGIPARGFDWDSVQFDPCRMGLHVDLKYGRALREGERNPGQVPVYGTNGRCGWHDLSLSDGPGLILGRKGQGHLGVKWEPGPFWVIDTAYYAVVDPAEIDLQWLYYACQYIGLDHLKSGEKPGLSRDVFRAQVVPKPTRSEQKAIAHILSALDDKIELNRRMNRTLEALAQKLFKSWFVDFDPVVAKSEGRKPFGLSDELAALFPPDFEESEQGPIPRGWVVARLDTLAEFRNGLAMQKFPPGPGESLPVLKIAELRAGSTLGADRASIDLDPRFVVDDGDLIFSWSGSLLVDVWAGGKAALNQHLFKVIPSGVPLWFCHQWLLEHLDDFQGIAADKATTMGHIRRHHLTDAKIVRPSEALLQELDRVFAPLAARQLQNKLQMRKLAALRDLLLPKLLSGEIRVGAAEPVVEEVT